MQQNPEKDSLMSYTDWTISLYTIVLLKESATFLKIDLEGEKNREASLGNTGDRWLPFQIDGTWFPRIQHAYIHL